MDVCPYGWMVPALDLAGWVTEHLLEPSGTLHNPDHLHLLQADLGFLWAGGPCARNDRLVIGMAELIQFRCHAWQRDRQLQQIHDWFGLIPDFLITLDARHCAEASDAEFAALVEHELYHCGQAKDGFGNPKFRKDTGRPCFAIRGHDVEEFVGVVRRYGVGEGDSPLAQMVEAGTQAPEVAKVDVSRACGTCQMRAA